MTNQETFALTQEIIRKLVASIDDGQWSARTPCSEWDVRAVLNHITSELLWIPEMFAGKRIDEVGDKYDGDVLGDDPKAVWQAASKATIAAISAPGADEKVVHLSFGDKPGKVYIQQMVIDQTIHAWDLAKGLGIDLEVPESLAMFGYLTLRPEAEAWRKSGAFGEAIPVAVDADNMTKLLALSGRDKNWQK